jgi:predicted peptidase
VSYLLYLPVDYGKDPQQKWPLILFLHGSGERGSDLELLKRQPLPKTLDRQKDFPFIVISPQLSLAMANWSDLIEPVKTLLDQIQASYSVDTQRIYLTGLSMGGFGTWEFALRYPRRFAAIVPIAGGYRFQSHAIPENICDLKDLPVWVFHGAQDTNVLPAQSEEMVEALRACGGKVRFTLYPDADHSASWTRAYANPDVYKWLLDKRLPVK